MEVMVVGNPAARRSTTGWCLAGPAGRSASGVSEVACGKWARVCQAEQLPMRAEKSRWTTLALQ
eukprot:scaffold324967_cov40-Prasinocladus_malaysianus.AAC.1